MFGRVLNPLLTSMHGLPFLTLKAKTRNLCLNFALLEEVLSVFNINFYIVTLKPMI